MICAPSNLPTVFAESEIPSGTITDAAAAALARLAWETAKAEIEAEQAGDHEQGARGDE